MSSDNSKYGYNAATGRYEDLMAAGIIDPTKVAFSLVELYILYTMVISDQWLCSNYLEFEYPIKLCTQQVSNYI